jgi:NTE family protein
MRNDCKGDKQVAYIFRNVVFEGGGVKGIAYIGALEVLEEMAIMRDISRAGGTSAGAVNAVLLSLKYDIKELQEILWDMDFHKFMDDTWGIVRDTRRLLNEFGWFKGDYFYKWIGGLIERKLGNRNATFSEFRKNGCLDLYLIGTNLSTGFAEIFSYEHTPGMRVADAVRISMSIPLFFTAFRDIRNDLFVDGGLLNNYPVKLFDRLKYVDENKRGHNMHQMEYYEAANKSRSPCSSKYIYNKETLGFRLEPEKSIAVFRDGAEPQCERIDGFFDYSRAVIKCIFNLQDSMHLHSDDWHRTIYINTGDIGLTDFNLDDSKKQFLLNEGRKGVRNYFNWYDNPNPNEEPINR